MIYMKITGIVLIKTNYMGNKITALQANGRLSVLNKS